MIKYQLPDIREEGQYIRSLDPDHIARVRDDIKFHLQAVLSIMDDALEGQEEYTCSICEEFGYGYRDIPSDWAYIADNGNTLLCNNCLGSWYLRFDLPELTRELELTDEQISSIPEDTTHRGQTHIEFV